MKTTSSRTWVYNKQGAAKFGYCSTLNTNVQGLKNAEGIILQRQASSAHPRTGTGAHSLRLLRQGPIVLLQA